DMLGHVRPWRQQERCTAGGRDRIQMRPIVEISQEHEPVTGRPIQIRTARHFRKRAGQCLRALPHEMSRAIGDAGYPYRPWMWDLLQQRLRGTACARLSYEGDARPIR